MSWTAIRNQCGSRVVFSVRNGRQGEVLGGQVWKRTIKKLFPLSL